MKLSKTNSPSTLVSSDPNSFSINAIKSTSLMSKNAAAVMSTVVSMSIGDVPSVSGVNVP